MFKYSAALIFVVLICLAAYSGMADNSKLSAVTFRGNTHPANDTVFQTDTLYQYEYVYDTIYYYDTLPSADTLVSFTDMVEESDSAVIINRTIDIVLTENRVVYIDKNNIPQEFTGRPFRENGKSTKPDIDYQSKDVKQTTPVINKRTNINPEPTPSTSQFTYISSGSRDTLFRYDTIFKFLTKYDTVAYERKARSDTSIYSRTTYEDFGRSVLVKQTVTVKVTESKDILRDQYYKWSSGYKPKDKKRTTKKSRTIVPSKYRSSFDHTPRVGDNHTFEGNLRVGLMFFEPDIKYSARDAGFYDEVDNMNKNHRPENSYGLAFTYQYFKDKLGVESGLGFSEQKYAYDYFYQELKKDTSTYWGIFEKEIPKYDTTWYFDIDTFLQTGDSVFIPKVDSSLITVMDSTLNIKVDTSYENRKSVNHYSLSFIEIPIIGHYTLLNRKFYLRVSGGVIPMFMISKTGTISYPESSNIIDGGQVLFDYGFMLSVYGSATLGYKFNKRWSVFAEPYFKRNVFSVIRNNEVKLSVNSWGVKAGVSFRLFRFQSK